MISVHKIVWHPRLEEKSLNCPRIGGADMIWWLEIWIKRKTNANSMTTSPQSLPAKLGHSL